MAAIPGNIETDRQPPMTIPLRHFVVALGLLAVAVLVGLGVVVDVVPGLATLAHVHLLLAGWICVTIMGAMTQFVPVWSGTTLHSRRLATVQLVLVLVGLVGFVAGLIGGSLVWLIPAGGLMLAGFWTFVYNIARTMASLDSYDVTERHFLLALGFFAALTVVGFLLAVGFTRPAAVAPLGDRASVAAAHATLAVFGAVLTTVYGALYQLGTMFTQTELHGIDEFLQRVEEVGHPVGVVLLAAGRLGEAVFVARVGAVLVLAAALAVGLILARKLIEMQVPWVPMHTRYAVGATGLVGWAVATAPAWLRAPTTPAHLVGPAPTAPLLLVGAVGFVVVGTLYHIVPFIIWVHRYSDRLGLADVPMVDDLYNDRLAAVDAALLVGGTLMFVLSTWLGFGAAVRSLGGGSVVLGVAVFGANMLTVIREHSPQPLGQVLFGSFDPRRDPSPTEDVALSEDSG